MFEFELPDATVRERARDLVFAPAALAVVGAVLALFGFAYVPPFVIIGILMWNVGGWLALLAWAKNAWPRVARGALTADREGVAVDGRRIVARAEIVRAYLQPAVGRDRARVKIHARGLLRDLEVVVPHEAAGRGMLEALGFDAAHALVKLSTVSLPMRAWWTQAAYALAFVLAARFASFASPILFVTLLVPFIVLAYVPTRVSVGSDGVRTSWLGIGRFIPYREIARVGTDHVGVYLELASGETFRIRTVWPNRGSNLLNQIFASNGEALAERIEQGRAAYGAGGGHEAALLRPDGKPLRAWMRDLRALGSGASASFRAAAVPEEHLWRVLESASAEGIERVAAAIALGADDERRARIRVAAEATASPTARVALEAVAAGDEERIAEAIEAMEGGDPGV